MPQRGGYLRLLAKPGELVAVAGEAAVQHLHRELSRQPRVGGQVNLAASPLRERTDDPIRVVQHRADREAGYRSQIDFRNVHFLLLKIHYGGLPTAGPVPTPPSA